MKITWSQRAWHLTRRVYSSTGYNGDADNLVNAVVNSMNGDDSLPFDFNVEFHGDVESNIRGQLKYNNHLEVLQSFLYKWEL